VTARHRRPPFTKNVKVGQPPSSPYAETIIGTAQINETTIDTITAQIAVRRSESAANAATANPKEVSPPTSQVVSVRFGMYVGGCFDIRTATNAQPMMVASAKDNTNDKTLNLRVDHHFDTSPLIGVGSFQEERDTRLSTDRFCLEQRHI